MIQPLIGITTYGRNEENRYHLPAAYVESVRRAGGHAVLLPPGEVDWAGLLPRLDGVILAGGGDIAPACYGGDAHETIYSIDSERDAAELALVRQLAAGTWPVLGICRGIQMINVALGGTLIEHLPDVVGEQIAHRMLPHGPTEHDVRVAPESRLAALMEQAEIRPVSWHHQGLRQVAPGLNVVAHAPDGTIEAVEMPGHPWLVAVQWHPELSAAADVTQQRLFDALVAAARQRTLAAFSHEVYKHEA